MPNETDDALSVVLVMIDELVIQLEGIQEALAETAGRLAKPSREALEAMRDVQSPVTPEAFLLARLHLAGLAVESASSWLESIDADIWLALDEAFAQGVFPLDLVQFRDLARGAGEDKLVGREGLEAAVAAEQA